MALLWFTGNVIKKSHVGECSPSSVGGGVTPGAATGKMTPTNARANYCAVPDVRKTQRDLSRLQSVQIFTYRKTHKKTV